jgi:hypothetical protein
MIIFLSIQGGLPPGFMPASLEAKRRPLSGVRTGSHQGLGYSPSDGIQLLECDHDLSRFEMSIFRSKNDWLVPVISF